ncbi:hypothetical protein JTE90_008826 [Oedothorax gibbosus]|uniref:Uncharacterized protein n=1 Tax=Oedothorax gibbosus TaxID=931172 RepID=A0AAV6V7R6_9ARAC|nr:hypothetical protein JTE90_008826 [Oedothorax gibbosus]
MYYYVAILISDSCYLSIILFLVLKDFPVRCRFLLVTEWELHSDFFGFMVTLESETHVELQGLSSFMRHP